MKILVKSYVPITKTVILSITISMDSAFYGKPAALEKTPELRENFLKKLKVAYFKQPYSLNIVRIQRICIRDCILFLFIRVLVTHVLVPRSLF